MQEIARASASGATDVLGELLVMLELGSQVYFRAELGHPFAIAVPEQPGVVRFHVVSEAPCVIAMKDGETVPLGAGDLVLVPHGSAHVLADAPGRPARCLSAILEESGFDGTGPLSFGGGGPRTVMVCGHFAFADTLLHPLVTGLPPLLHVRAQDGPGYAWMAEVVRHMEGEVKARAIGHAAVVRRLSELLLVEVLRAQADRDEGGVLTALADPQLGRALQAMHAEPAGDWSLDALARLAGQSRTLFVERFREHVGTTPMRYLATRRLLEARRLLARPGHSVAEVARRVGYASESAFNRAFREHFGAPPGRFRREEGVA